MQRVLSSLPGAGLDLFPVCGAFTVASRKPQLVQDMAVLVFSTLLCMDHRQSLLSALASSYIAGMTWRFFMSP